MASRLNLHEELCDILGNRNGYFQPPESVKMSYPCIRYSLSTPDAKRANNSIYNSTNKYELTVIDYNPDSDIYKKILARFPMCRLDRVYVANDFNHFVLTLFY